MFGACSKCSSELMRTCAGRQITGRLERADHDVPIEGAKVQLNIGRASGCCIVVQTDRNGVHTFQSVPDGVYAFAAFADGLPTRQPLRKWVCANGFAGTVLQVPKKWNNAYLAPE